MAFLCLRLSAQVTGEVNVLDRDVFQFVYTPPNVISNDFSYQHLSGKLGIPPVKTGNLSLFSTLGVDVHKFSYQEDSIGAESPALNTFQQLNLSFIGQYTLNDKWSVNALVTPYVTADFGKGSPLEDVRVNGNLFVERNFPLRNGGYLRAGLGAAYITLNGTTRFVPVTHLKARLNEKWSFVLGLPNTYVKWDINQKHSLEILADLNDVTASLSTPQSNAFGAETAVFTVASAGLEYNYWVTPSAGLMFRATHAVWDSYELRDEDGLPLYTFDSSLKQPFISVGVKFNPVRKMQNSLQPTDR